MNELTLSSPLDMHLHLRDDEMLKLVTPLTSETFSGAVIMPNLVPPIDSLRALEDYRHRITMAQGDHVFNPYMTVFFRHYTEDELAELEHDILGIKLYPAGATTNSEAGVKALDAVEPTFKMMEEMGIPLMVHGETHGFVMDREKEFLASYEYLAKKIPQTANHYGTHCDGRRGGTDGTL
jgi:dihydroorotase